MRITTQRSVRGTNALLAAVLGVSMLVLAWGVSVGNVYVAIFVGVVAALCFVLVGTVNLVPDDSRSEATERTLRVAVGTLSTCAAASRPTTPRPYARFSCPRQTPRA